MYITKILYVQCAATHDSLSVLMTGNGAISCSWPRFLASGSGHMIHVQQTFSPESHYLLFQSAVKVLDRHQDIVLSNLESSVKAPTLQTPCWNLAHCWWCSVLNCTWYSEVQLFHLLSLDDFPSQCVHLLQSALVLLLNLPDLDQEPGHFFTSCSSNKLSAVTDMHHCNEPSFADEFQ